MTGSANARPANSSAMRFITRRVLLLLILGVQFCFRGEVLQEGYNAVNF